jgi:glycosyltransferase involved in cell wall biosynthesis
MKLSPVILDARVVIGTGGGPEKTILNQPRFLPGYRNVCAYMHPPDDAGFAEIRRRAGQYGAPLESVPDRGPWDLRVLQRLLELCRRERVAIWHGHDYKSNAIGLLLSRCWPMRLVTTVHGWVKHTRRTPLYYGIDRFCVRRFERVICVSPDLRDECVGRGVPRPRCVLIENGIDTAEYRRTGPTAEAKARLGIASDQLVIGAVGRLSAEKGFHLLIRAADELLHRGMDLRLLIVGDGDERPRLECLISALGREDRIQLLGYRADTTALYQAMDVFVLSSLREGLPNVLLEAMALEVPVVATRIAGVPRLVQHEANGLLVDAGAQEALTDAIARLMTSAELRARLAAEGRRTIEHHYSFAVRMQRIREIYDELLSSN